MFTGRYKGYHWLVTTSFGIASLLRMCPNVLLRKYLVITAFDGGPISPNPEELKAGWTAYGETMCSPLLISIDGLPFDNNDEWYVFTEPKRINNPETFVGYGAFTLRNPKYLQEEADPTWDVVGVEHQRKYLEELQEKFWKQVEENSPESYIADGDSFIYVTEDEKLFEAVKKAVRQYGV